MGQCEIPVKSWSYPDYRCVKRLYHAGLHSRIYHGRNARAVRFVSIKAMCHDVVVGFRRCPM